MISATSATAAACPGSCTSVRMGTPWRALTSANNSSPLSRPGPRNDRIDERLALSKLALNTKGIPSARVTVTKWSATSSSTSRSSITLMPPISTNGRSLAKLIVSVRRMVCGAVMSLPRDVFLAGEAGLLPGKSDALNDPALLQDSLDRGNVFGIVQFDAIPADGLETDQPDWPLAFQKAQLLQPFQRLQRRRRHCRIRAQCLGAIGVKAKVQAHRLMAVGQPGGDIRDHPFGKIQRMTAPVGDHRGPADTARLLIADKMRICARRAAQPGGRHRRAVINRQCRHQLGNDETRSQRGVALQIDDHVEFRAQPVKRIGAALGAVAAVRRGHHHLAAELTHLFGDPLIIGSNEHRRCPGHSASRIPTALDQRLGNAARAHQRRQRLARKTLRRIARRYQDGKTPTRAARVGVRLLRNFQRQFRPYCSRSWICTIPTGRMGENVSSRLITNAAVILASFRNISASLASISEAMDLGGLVITSPASAELSSLKWRRRSPSVTAPINSPRSSTTPAR